MQEGDALALGAEPRLFVDQADAELTAALEGSLEVVDGEADMVNSRPAFRDEFPDGRVGDVGLEQLDERIPGREPGDAGAVGVVERDFGEAEHVAIKRDAV